MKVQTLNMQTFNYDTVTEGKWFRLELDGQTIDITERADHLCVSTIGGRIIIKPSVSNSIEVSVEQ